MITNTLQDIVQPWNWISRYSLQYKRFSYWVTLIQHWPWGFLPWLSSCTVAVCVIFTILLQRTQTPRESALSTSSRVSSPTQRNVTHSGFWASCTSEEADVLHLKQAVSSEQHVCVVFCFFLIDSRDCWNSYTIMQPLWLRQALHATPER